MSQAAAAVGREELVRAERDDVAARVLVGPLRPPIRPFLAARIAGERQCETPDGAIRKGYEEALADDGRRAGQRPSQLHRRLSIANRLVSSLAALVTPYGQHPAGSGAGNLVNGNTVGAQ